MVTLLIIVGCICLAPVIITGLIWIFGFFFAIMVALLVAIGFLTGNGKVTVRRRR